MAPLRPLLLHLLRLWNEGEGEVSIRANDSQVSLCHSGQALHRQPAPGGRGACAEVEGEAGSASGEGTTPGTARRQRLLAVRGSRGRSRLSPVMAAVNGDP